MVGFDVTLEGGHGNLSGGSYDGYSSFSTWRIGD
jgi:hypothetical protein